MKDRQSTYPGRVILTPVPDAPNTYDMVLADIPIQAGTELNTKNLLADSTAALLELGEDATPNDALVEIAYQLADIQNALNDIQNRLNNLIRSGTQDIGVGSSLQTGSIYLVYK